MTLSEKKTTLKVLHHLRRISLILLVLVTLAALILNLGRLSVDDLGRLAARVRYGFSGKREEASSIVFTESEGKAVCVYKDGIAVAADGYLKVFDSSGLLLSQTLLSMESPSLSATSRYLLSFDRGGKSVLVSQSFGEKQRFTFEKGVIDASLSEAGALIVAHKGEGYRSQISVYDTSLKERYKWFAADTYITATSVYGLPTRFACAGLTLRDGSLFCEVLAFSPDSAEPLCRVRVPGSFVYRVKCLDQNNLLCLTDLGYSLLDLSTGQVLHSGAFGQSSLGCYAVGSDRLVLGFSGRSGEGYEVRTVTFDGKETSALLPELPQSLAVSGKTYVLTGGKVLAWNGSSFDPVASASRQENRLIAGKGGVLLVGTHAARFIS